MTTIRSHVEAMGVDPATLEDTDEYFEVIVQLPVGPGVKEQADIIDPGNALTADSYVQVRRRIGALSDSVPEPPAPPAPTYFLDEKFDGTVLNTTDLWTIAAGTPTVANGQLVLPYTNPRTIVKSKVNYALAGKTAEFRGWTVPLAPNETGKVRSLRLQVPTAIYNYARFLRTGSGLFMDGVNITGQTIPYDAAAHANLRFRVADQLYYEASADGTTWTTLKTAATPPFLANPAQVEISAGSDNATASDASTQAKLDGFRIP